MRPRWLPHLASALFVIVPVSFARAEMPDAIAARGETPIATIHAEGAQVYECKVDVGGKLVWHFREPIATRLLDAAMQAAAARRIPFLVLDRPNPLGGEDVSGFVLEPP